RRRVLTPLRPPFSPVGVSGLSIRHAYPASTGGTQTMIGIRDAVAFALSLMLAATPAVAADEPDELIPGQSALIRYGVVAKFISKPATAFDLPDANNSPIAEGG